MNLIIPMAGRGSRLRPHTLTVPKPLIPIAGVPIVERLVSHLVNLAPEKVERIAFVVGDFGDEVAASLRSMAARFGAEAIVVEQTEPLGTAHAIWCAKELLEGEVVVAFADTLFTTPEGFKLSNEGGTLFVKEIEDPRQFGVVVLDAEGCIASYAEKPENPVSNLAMIGIYHIVEGEKLGAAIQRLIDEKVRHGGEYQLPDALRHMTESGVRFSPGVVDRWMDCGNAKVTIETNSQVLSILGNRAEVHTSVVLEDSVVVPPCSIGEGTVIRNSVVGPNVSLGNGCLVLDSRLSDCLVSEHARLDGVNLQHSMVGNHANITRKADQLSAGDYTEIK